MRHFLTLALAALLTLGIFTGDAAAKRFGGGKSFGKQREQVTQPARPAAPAGAPAPAGGRSWLGPLAGLAAGGLLGAMLFGHGFDGIKPFDILLIAALALGLYLLFRRARPAPQSMSYAGMPGPASPSSPGPQALGGFGAAQDARPAWFEDEPFLRAAKLHFIRLQEAYDRGDLQDIREYTTPEVFAEIQMQIQERAGAANKTEILQLNAEMVSVATEGDLVLASVRFTGQVREEAGAPAISLNEIWNIQKSAQEPNASWFVAGIQQAQ